MDWIGLLSKLWDSASSSGVSPGATGLVNGAASSAALGGSATAGLTASGGAAPASTGVMQTIGANLKSYLLGPEENMARFRDEGGIGPTVANADNLTPNNPDKLNQYNKNLLENRNPAGWTLNNFTKGYEGGAGDFIGNVSKGHYAKALGYLGRLSDAYDPVQYLNKAMREQEEAQKMAEQSQRMTEQSQRMVQRKRW